MGLSKFIAILLLLFPALIIEAQNKIDSIVKVDQKVIILSEIVINSKLDVASFIKRIQNDTTFYKAFRTLHIVGFTALNDVRMLNKNGGIQASLRSKIKQVRDDNCRSMKVLEETTYGNICDENNNFN